MGWRFKPNPALVPELEAGAAFQALLEGKAGEVRSGAEAAAPVHTGHYKDRFYQSKLARGYRVGNTDFAAHIVEWGSVNNPPYAPLRRGVQAAGLHLHDPGKP
jgi:hypothetical protein